MGPYLLQNRKNYGGYKSKSLSCSTRSINKATKGGRQQYSGNTLFIFYSGLFEGWSRTTVLWGKRRGFTLYIPIDKMSPVGRSQRITQQQGLARASSSQGQAGVLLVPKSHSKCSWGPAPFLRSIICFRRICWGRKVPILHMHFYHTADRHLHSPLHKLCHHVVLSLFSCCTSVTSFLFSQKL